MVIVSDEGPMKNEIGSQGIRVALISLYHYGAFGTRILGDLLRNHGHKTFQIFFKQDSINQMWFPTETEIKLLMDLLKDIQPDLIGISVRSTFFPVAKEITLQMKEWSNTPVIWGGAHPTICPDESIQYPDMICWGEGDQVIVELAEKIARKQDLSDVRGLWINTEGTILKNEPQCLLEDLDSLPLGDFNDDHRSYAIESNQVYQGDPVYNDDLSHYNFVTGRGCPFQCDFCSNSILKKMFAGKGPFLRQRSVGNVIQELESCSSNDEVFGLNKQWLKEFCTQYKREIGLPFHCDIHPAFANEETIAMLAEAGLKTISMGIQSGSARTREDLYGRKTSEAQLREVASLYKQYKIFPSYDLLFDNPLETEEDVHMTFEFMMSLPRPYRLNMYSLLHLPKTRLTERLLQEQFITPNDVAGNSTKGFNHWQIRLDDPHQKAEILHLYKMLFLLSSFVSLSRKNPGKVIPVFPRRVIRFMEKNRYLRQHQRVTERLTALVPKITFRVGLLFQGKFLEFYQRTVLGFMRRIRQWYRMFIGHEV
jgi:anaerobic magnesium-protoporphyrin IX monomethyl ester cyclase